MDGVAELPDLRDREAEFRADGGATREQLLQSIDSVVAEATDRILSVPSAELLQPRNIQGFEITVLGAISHSVPHFVGHTHQIVQLTRLALGDKYVMHWQPDHDRSRVPI